MIVYCIVFFYGTTYWPVSYQFAKLAALQLWPGSKSIIRIQIYSPEQELMQRKIQLKVDFIVLILFLCVCILCVYTC